MATLLVPKGPRAAESQAEPTVEQLRAQLFALPLPPSPTRTRTYPTHTTLGRIMRLRGLTITQVAKIPNGPSYHQISYALAGTRGLSREHWDALAEGLGVDRRLLD